MAHEVQQPRFDSVREHRGELQAAYAGLAGSDFLGVCCLQLVEMVVMLRRDHEPDPSVAHDIATA